MPGSVLSGLYIFFKDIIYLFYFRKRECGCIGGGAEGEGERVLSRFHTQCGAELWA